MILKYEKACAEAGLPEEQIKEIRRLFDREAKRRKTRKEQREKYGIRWNSMEAMQEGDQNHLGVELAATGEDVADVIIHQMELEQLRECLKVLTEEEQQMVLTYYSGIRGAETELARQLGIPRTTLIKRRQKAFEKVQAAFLQMEESEGQNEQKNSTK